ncbi:hypothetical protein LXL04_028050 [Taraxacum kok-saghyz]
MTGYTCGLNKCKAQAFDDFSQTLSMYKVISAAKIVCNFIATNLISSTNPFPSPGYLFFDFSSASAAAVVPVAATTIFMDVNAKRFNGLKLVEIGNIEAFWVEMNWDIPFLTKSQVPYMQPTNVDAFAIGIFSLGEMANKELAIHIIQSSHAQIQSSQLSMHKLLTNCSHHFTLQHSPLDA